ncbi:GIY-YIG nuclease family protein [Streptococcus mutans]|uniref:GIY-YIG nuclease family protein n=1 Tax=Streptococcus mutans TaxID=1309 RepID=UPI0028E9269A|nr:GIY-YIG nuclease family protein [Streptococcus mutans]MDT9521227.1 GIY-YIG nuclease family protein [Streptococcus mutans]
MSDIKLNDIFGFTEEEIPHVKIYFHVWKSDVNYTKDYYLSNKEQVNHWNIFYNADKKHFKVGETVINAVKVDYDKYLVTMVKKVTKDLNRYNDQGYEGENVEKFKPYFDRLIIKYKPGRSRVRKYGKCYNEIIVSEILSEPWRGDDFNGYDEICLSYSQLESIFRLEKRDWLTALQNQKAVYLITDKKTGQLYVGSATSKDKMLLSRWNSYVNNGHGGNTELHKLVTEKGFNYVKENFQYSLLENFNGKVDDDYIIGREQWWKKVLQSIKFGYNDN